jgi:hypothetical protein
MIHIKWRAWRRSVGAGDLATLITAPTFVAGSIIKHNGVTLTMLEDCGSYVRFEVPPTRRALKGGGHLGIAAGNTGEIDKATFSA